MKCLACREEILQKDPQKCPYCGSRNFVSKEDEIPGILTEIKILEKAGQYEEAALKFEELEMWDKAKEIRDLNMGKISSVNIVCPHCGDLRLFSSKSNEVKCRQCSKIYLVPKKVLELF
jgi:DNA-directed RNA polymerase subunit RPC12/RpoP